MRVLRLAAFSCAVLLLTGCASLLEREYSSVEPHSNKYWESNLSDTLRAENYQDIVNDLLILIGQHKEAATVRLYGYEEDLSIAELLEQATSEVQQETPLGAYAVEYITSSSQYQRSYYEIFLQISYRRTEEQIQSIVNATSAEALPSLLDSALKEEKSELVIRIGYWNAESAAQLNTAVTQAREASVIPDSTPWLISYYPSEEAPELIEFLFDVPPEVWAALEDAGTASGETPEAASEGVGEPGQEKTD